MLYKLVSNSTGDVCNTRLIFLVACTQRYFICVVQTEVYVNNIFTKLLIRNNICKNIAAATATITSGNTIMNNLKEYSNFQLLEIDASFE